MLKPSVTQRSRFAFASQMLERASVMRRRRDQEEILWIARRAVVNFQIARWAIK
jgi:hypothetical protein